MGKKIGCALGVLALAAASAAYGFFLHEDRFFPYHQARRIYLKVLRRAYERLAPSEPPHRFHPGRPGEAGVRVYDRALAEDGLNLWTSGHAPIAVLMDMDGTPRLEGPDAQKKRRT